jgi:hypothetical protein
MLTISFKSSRSHDQILDEAQVFFQLEGLRSTVKDDNSIRFEFGRGYVYVEVTHQNEVTVQTDNLDPLVQEFAEHVK